MDAIGAAHASELDGLLAVLPPYIRDEMIRECLRELQRRGVHVNLGDLPHVERLRFCLATLAQVALDLQ